MKYLLVTLGGAMLGILAGCSSTPEDPKQCGVTTDLSVDATAGVQGADGAVTVIGRTAYAPSISVTGSGGASSGTSGTSGSGGAPATELAVYDVYVGGTRVTQTSFNFRSWTVNIPLDELCAYAPGAKTQATLPVRIYLSGPGGVCTYELPQQVVVPLVSHTCDSTFDAGGVTDAAADG